MLLNASKSKQLSKLFLTSRYSDGNGGLIRLGGVLPRLDLLQLNLPRSSHLFRSTFCTFVYFICTRGFHAEIFKVFMSLGQINCTCFFQLQVLKISMFCNVFCQTFVIMFCKFSYVNVSLNLSLSLIVCLMYEAPVKELLRKQSNGQIIHQRYSVAPLYEEKTSVLNSLTINV